MHYKSLPCVLQLALPALVLASQNTVLQVAKPRSVAVMFKKAQDFIVREGIIAQDDYIATRKELCT